MIATASSDSSIQVSQLSSDVSISIEIPSLNRPYSGVGGRPVAEWNASSQSPFVAVTSPLTHMDSFYALTADGTLSCITLSENAMSFMSPSKCKTGVEAEVEKFGWSRNLELAWNAVVNIAKSPAGEGVSGLVQLRLNFFKILLTVVYFYFESVQLCSWHHVLPSHFFLSFLLFNLLLGSSFFTIMNL